MKIKIIFSVYLAFLTVSVSTHAASICKNIFSPQTWVLQDESVFDVIREPSRHLNRPLEYADALYVWERILPQTEGSLRDIVSWSIQNPPKSNWKATRPHSEIEMMEALNSALELAAASYFADKVKNYKRGLMWRRIGFSNPNYIAGQFLQILKEVANGLQHLDSITKLEELQMHPRLYKAWTDLLRSKISLPSVQLANWRWLPAVVYATQWNKAYFAMHSKTVVLLWITTAVLVYSQASYLQDKVDVKTLGASPRMIESARSRRADSDIRRKLQEQLQKIRLMSNLSDEDRALAKVFEEDP